MNAAPTLLKALLTERHMQSHAAFCREYMAVARRIDPALVATAPGREQYHRWISGRIKTTPHPDHCRVLVRMFPGRTVEELFSPNEQPPQQPRQLLVEEEESPTNRRELFQYGGGAVAGVFVDLLWSEPGRMNSLLDSTTISAERLEQLHQRAIEMGTRAIQMPPGTLLDETLMHFRATRKLLTKKQPLGAHRELVRCAAMFATVMGELLFNGGQFPLARHWYETAHHAAREAQDQYLADIALAGSTYIPTYAPDPRGVLDNVNPRLEAKYAPTPAIAWLWGFKAKAHAMLGDSREFEKAIECAHRVLDSSSPSLIRPGIFSFVPEKLAFYEARGRVELGDAEQASDAAERALSLYDPTENTEPALARFEKASALAQAGEIPEACGIATAAVLDRHTYHSITVVSRAGEFDSLLGSTSCDASRDWREVLASLRGPRLALSGPGEPSGE